MAYRVTELTQDQLQRAAEQAAESFLHHDGGEEIGGFPFLGLTRDQMTRYMKVLIRTAMETGNLWSVTDRIEGLIYFNDSGDEMSLGQALALVGGICRAMGPAGTRKFLKLISAGGTSLEQQLKKEKKRYVSVGMLVVMEAFQGQGCMRQLMDLAFEKADRLGVPCILDTDTRDKADRYAHLGMRIWGTRRMNDQVTFYDMIREPREEKQEAQGPEMSLFGNPRGRTGRVLLRTMNTGHSPMARWTISEYDWPEDSVILDIGCGGGKYISRFLKLCPKGRVYGIDISKDAVRVSRETNRKDLGRRCRIEAAGADRIPIRDGRIDTVTAFETIYFWPDVPAAFREIRRVLKAGGRLIVSCETGDSGFWEGKIPGMTMYGADRVRDLMEEAGFRNVTIHRRGGLFCLDGTSPGQADSEGKA